MPSTTKEPEETISFEVAMSRLESLIEALEDGDVPLSDLITKFEEGSGLLRICQSELKAAEQKIEILNTKSGELGNFEPLDPQDAS